MPPKRAAAAKKEEKTTKDIFADKVFALSGTLTKTRDEITGLLEDNGGTCASSVTKKVTHLVSTSEDFAASSSKVETAKKNGIFIVSEDYIHDSIKEGAAVKEEKYSLNGTTTSTSTTAKKRKAEDDAEEAAEEAEEKPKKVASKKKKAEAEAAAEKEEKAERPKRGKAKKVEKEESSDSSSEEEKPTKKADDDEGVKKKIVVKGGAAVDSCVPAAVAKGAHVYADGDCIYDAMLNQTNISQNNNKFYVVQVLEKDGGGQFWTFNRWGRVGEPGQNKLEPHGTNKAGAINSFKKKFYDKSRNQWENRAKFVPQSGKYTLIEIDYGADEEPKKDESKKKEKKPVSRAGSKLDDRVQDLVKLIFDLKMMETSMVEMEFDVKKMPLGKLTKKQIKDGYEVLKELDEAIKRGDSSSLERLTSRFYTLIPHSFGRSVPPVIRNSETLKKKMAMLEALADIEIATKLMKETEESGDNPIDHNYSQLKCDVVPVDTNTDEYKEIEKYVKNTHQGSTPKIKCVYRIARTGEKDRFEKTVPIGNRKLLWHGSRLTNYVGIISQGLRIAPPEAPVSGYRFGKGIYFADVMSLSSVYCRTGGSNDFCMLLGDVVLGKEAELERDTYMEKPVSGHHSTKALGTIEPSPKEDYNHKDGYIIPNGKIVDSGKKSVSCREHQYIVYDVSQCHLRYLLHLNWK